jgi:hypothetical protein
VIAADITSTLVLIFALIAKMKLRAGYTDAIGTDLGIVGSAETEKALPKFSVRMLQGGGCQFVKLTFTNTITWASILRAGAAPACASSSPSTPKALMKTSARWSPQPPEVREYRMRLWDKVTPNGDWTDVVKVTVSP